MTSEARPKQFTERDLWKADCRNKRGFKSENIAQAAARHTRDASGERMHPYRCRLCRKWHLGH